MRWTLLLLACAHAPTVTTEQVVRLPPDARQQIAQARGGVELGDQNLTAAKMALDEARSFRDITDRELDGARIHGETAQRSVELGQRSGAELSLQAARLDREAAMRELSAERAKKDYADQLVDLRRAELDERRAELDQANAGFEYEKLQQLQAYGLAGGLNEVDFMTARDCAAGAVAHERTRVARLRGTVEALRSDWLQRADEQQTASRAHLPAPPAPRSMDYSEPSASPSGAANEGPSAGQSMPQY